MNDSDTLDLDEAVTRLLPYTDPNGVQAQDGKPYLQPCLAIAPQERDIFGSNLADRFSALTLPLPLAGAPLLAKEPDGQLALTARLLARAPWLEPAILTIDRQLRLQLWAGRPWLAWRPLCLAGPPGTGKSHLARLIGELAGTGCAVLDLGGTADNRTLEGTARGWASAQPCWPAVAVAQLRTANPVLVVEEIDKAGGSERSGVPHATLLTMLERGTAQSYWDKALLAEVNLAHCCWVLTCNDASLLPAVLRSRLTVIEVGHPSAEHFEAVLNALLAAQAQEWGIAPAELPRLPRKAKAVLRQVFTRQRSIRALRGALERVLEALVDGAVRRVH